MCILELYQAAFARFQFGMYFAESGCIAIEVFALFSLCDVVCFSPFFQSLLHVVGQVKETVVRRAVICKERVVEYVGELLFFCLWPAFTGRHWPGGGVMMARRVQDAQCVIGLASLRFRRVFEYPLQLVVEGTFLTVVTLLWQAAVCLDKLCDKLESGYQPVARCDFLLRCGHIGQQRVGKYLLEFFVPVYHRFLARYCCFSLRR